MDAALVSGVVVVTATDRADVQAVLDDVHDPEIPALSIADIGMLRSVAEEPDGTVVVTITPTYSGCPALEVIQDDIVVALANAGFTARVDVSYNPPWTTEWMSDDAKRRLRESGIAPPGPLGVVEEVLCPNCSSGTGRVVSEFGSTACKRLLVCTTCGDPFDHFKEI